jgi:hypothetical protein
VALRATGLLVLEGSIGVSKDAWSVQLFGQKLTDENKSQFTSASQ